MKAPKWSFLGEKKANISVTGPLIVFGMESSWTPCSIYNIIIVGGQLRHYHDRLHSIHCFLPAKLYVTLFNNIKKSYFGATTCLF